MKDFWAGAWLHCAPDRQFSNGRRAVLKRLCFGPVETQTWFVSEDGGCWYEARILEGIQAGERFLKPICRVELLQAFGEEIDLCRRFHGDELIPLFQDEQDALARDDLI